ncbi:MAG TPA: glycosyltransferase [Symbiobacteriaceae bacterium]
MGKRLSLCMVVRDEERDLPRCLDSVRGLVDEIVIVDTGSKDQTVAVARRYGAVVRQISWQNDFAAARNASLELATGDWVLVLDADEVLLPEETHVLPLLLSDPGTEGYFLTVKNLLGSPADPQYQCDPVFRLFRRRPAYRFVGRVHEQILPVIQAVNPQAVVRHSPLTILHYGYLDEYVRAQNKRQRNIRLLEASLAARPGDPFLLFNLGREHMRSGADRRAAAAFGAALARAPAEAPWRPALIKWYADTLNRLGRRAAALEVLRQGIRDYPDYTDLHYLLGMVHGALGQWDAAIRAFEACRARGPAPCPPYASTEPELGNSKADYMLGMALLRVGRDQEAQEAFARAAAARPGWLAPLQQLCRLLAARGDEQALLQVLNRHFPGNSPSDQVMQALLLARTGCYEPALERLKPLASTGEMNRPAAYVYALVLAKLGRYPEALALCGQEVWEGTALFLHIRALTLYCYLKTEDRAGIRRLTADRSQLRELYTTLAGLLWDEPEAELTRLARNLPRGSVLVELVRKERLGEW